MLTRTTMIRLSILPLLAPLTALTAGQNYPVTEAVEQVDDFYGITVADPYRWLEEDVRQSDRVRDWVTRQNQVTFGYLQALPGRDAIRQRLTQLWNYDKYGTPQRIGERYVVSIRKSLDNHAIVYTMTTLDGPKKILFNPNTWSEDGTVALGGLSFSEDGHYAAYAIQEAGSDWRTWKVRVVETGVDLPDTLTHLKFTDPAWDHDGTGFYYGRYPRPEPGAQFTSLNLDMKLMYHRLGTDPNQDAVVYYQPDHPDWSYHGAVTEEGRYLVITVLVGTDDKYRIIYRDLSQADNPFVDLIDRFDNLYSLIDNDGPVFYFHTDFEAPRGRVIAIDLTRPQPQHWRELIPQVAEPLQSVTLVNNQFICTYLKDVKSQVKLFTLEGKPAGEVEFPVPGTAGGFGGKRNHTETFYSFQSHAVPPSIYRHDLTTGQSTLLEKPRIDINPADYITTQEFFRSKDGTLVPMFITHRKGLEKNGSNPTLLYGYGGFNVSLLPSFSPTRLAWLEMGGVYAVANIRGGGEYGKDWHDAGRKMKKVNVFDDFIAAAEHLIATQVTSPAKLAIEGGSNGGLLVGACLTRRPDLFAAAIPVVGVMDMLRFDQFTAGRFWTDDYGSVKDGKEMFQYLLDYSPYHTLKPGTAYPATLVVTADTDDRVVPGHSFKFAARLQQCQQGDAPALIRIETRAGHGSGKPTAMIIEEQADIYAFLAKNLGLTPVFSTE